MVNPLLNVSLLSCVLVELRDSTEDCHMTQYDLDRETGLSPPVNISLTVPRLCFFCGSFLLVMHHVGVCCAVVSVPCSLVAICLEAADLLAFACVVFSCVLSLSQMCPSPHQN